MFLSLIQLFIISFDTTISTNFNELQSKKKPIFFWINALAPLLSIILGSLLVYFTHAERHGVQVVTH